MCYHSDRKVTKADPKERDRKDKQEGFFSPCLGRRAMSRHHTRAEAHTPGSPSMVKADKRAQEAWALIVQSVAKREESPVRWSH